MNLKYTFKILFLLFSSSASQAYAESSTLSGKLEKIDDVLTKHCGVCHKVPPAYLMPKKYWPRAVRAMAELSAKRMGREFIPEEVGRVISNYYVRNSPEALPVLPYYQNNNSPQTFVRSELAKRSKVPLVVNARSVQLDGSQDPQFLICDAERNQVLLLSNTGKTWQETVLAEVQIPIHTEVVDYDLDGDKDIIVAALGAFPPSERLVGEVLILRQSAPGKFDKEVLLNGVGRVTDARAVDIDNDNDLDLAVAIFGGGVVGELVWLENLGQGKHAKHVLLDVSGALNVSPVDLNGDGKMDFVSLIAQEHEIIVALINKGAGKFEKVRLGQAPHPMFGSTGMKLVDLDGDSDVDILFTNGDANDLQMDPKPYHGVQWFENKGKFKFQYHDIGRFYGAAAAVAGDLDADGDLDVVASSWHNYWEDARRQSLIWFENDGKQNFTRHNIINRPQNIVSLELKDITGDNRLDIIAGVFRMDLLIKRLTANSGKGEQRKPAIAEQELLNSRVILLENKAGSNDYLFKANK